MLRWWGIKNCAATWWDHEEQMVREPDEMGRGQKLRVWVGKIARVNRTRGQRLHVEAARMQGQGARWQNHKMVLLRHNIVLWNVAYTGLWCQYFQISFCSLQKSKNLCSNILKLEEQEDYCTIIDAIPTEWKCMIKNHVYKSHAADLPIGPVVKLEEKYMARKKQLYFSQWYRETHSLTGV